ncbi:MAG: hypothetical protein H0W73_10810 [Bacteroidetes bacterium]|nr:hypothetical protein [Bacteroidota bacterium]
MAIIITEIKLHHSTFILYSNTILEIYLNDNCFYTMTECVDIEIAIEKLRKQSELRVILIAGLYSDSDAEARQFAASDKIFKNIIAMAMVTRSLAQDLLGNFIIAFDKPSKPAKVFHSREKAMDWILKT